MDWMAIIPGLAVGAVGVGISYWWFGLRLRGQLEASAGAHALSAMKWRECAGLVLEALSRQGYREESSSRQPGEGSGSEFMLRRGDDAVLMSYKHGSAYRLGESNIRELANAIQLCGASQGLLVTLGSIEDVARSMARRYEVKLLDGHSVWPMVQDLVPTSLQASIRQQATAKVRTRLLAGMAGSVVLASVLVFLAVREPEAGIAGDAVTTATGKTAASRPAAPAPANPATVVSAPAPSAVATDNPAPAAVANPLNSSAGIEAANKALEEIAKLRPEQLARRRAEVAGKIAGMAKVRTASWSTQSTLVLALAESDGKEVALVTEACAALARYEELRYTRLQLEPPAGSQQRVRWRMCQ